MIETWSDWVDEPSELAGQPESEDSGAVGLCRRAVLKGLAGLGIGSVTVRRAIAAQAAQAGRVTPEMIKQAEWIAGVEFTEDERTSAARSVEQSLQSFGELRGVDVGYDVPPALTFFPVPPRPAAAIQRNRATPIPASTPRRPGSDEELAFLTVAELSSLLRSRQVSSTELTRLYLDRLKRFDPLLKCVVTFTEEVALKQAAQADKELASGQYRGPLHGIPWGAKDLIAYPGYPTTWGATPFKDRVIDVTASVAARLEEAGAVLLAKLSLGALAMGDRWFGGRTRSPWDPRTGSSGSSAGSASAAAAGLVGFAIGSETLGSIVSPCRACGASGLRPTFGRVSRYGCMTLSWSMDKLGPITRSAEDCARIRRHPRRRWPRLRSRGPALPVASEGQPRRLKIGYIEDRNQPSDEREELMVLRELGFELVPMTLPDRPPGARHHDDAGDRGRRGLRRAHAQAYHGRAQFVAGHVPPGSIRAGRRVSPGRPRADQAHAGHGPADGESGPLRRLRGGPADHQPDRPPDRCLPDGLPRPQWPLPARFGHSHRPALRRVDPPGRRPRHATGHRRPPPAASPRAIPGRGRRAKGPERRSASGRSSRGLRPQPKKNSKFEIQHSRFRNSSMRNSES